MKILFLSGWYPFPPDNGSKLRIFNLIRGISVHHDVSLISLADDSDRSHASDLEGQCKIIRVIPRHPYNAKNIRSILGLFSPTPRAIVDTLLPSVRSSIKQELSSRKFDLIIASQWMMAAYWSSFQGVPAIYEELELGMSHARKESAKTSFLKFRHQLTILKLKFYLQHILQNFQACTVVSKKEEELLRRTVPKYRSIEVIPNCVDLKTYQKLPSDTAQNTIIFPGSLRYFANHDAMIWFIEEILPRIQSKVPDARLLITGDHGNLPLPPSRNVTLTGWIKDIKELIASSTASIAPIRMGGGTRLKILEAMALRTPVVTTSIGVEGLSVKDQHQAMIADDPDLFADEVVRLLTSSRLRERITNNAYELVRMEYDWENVMPRFMNIIDCVADV